MFRILFCAVSAGNSLYIEKTVECGLSYLIGGCKRHKMFTNTL